MASAQPGPLVVGTAAVEPELELQREPTIDANGVDREQIRRMLRMTPEERLRTVEEMVESVLEIWEINGTRPVR